MPRLSSALLSLLTYLLVVPATAQHPMSAEEFDAYVTGRTLAFGFEGQVYGVEEFRPGRRTTWAFIGEECREGVWYPRGDQICFAYENDPVEHCWVFWRDDEGLNARFMGEEAGTEFYEVGRSSRPLQCPGPEVGV